MELQKLAQALDLYVRPQTFPVVPSMIASPSEIPEKNQEAGAGP